MGPATVDEVIFIEFSDGSTLEMPEGVTVIMIKWLQCLTSNGFSDVTITSKKQKHELLVQLNAGSLIRARIPLHQAEDIRNRLVGRRSSSNCK